ncbi:MAG TPA: tetratricopeptide repeat protein [Ktedonobacterales bacterium]|nr:tetratricopeptide repeat protein [Ktedonobacterales bacterium]
MSAPAIFVSHSHKDDAYCQAFVAALRAAGLDVWYDEHNATAGHLRELIERELRLRPIFVVVLTPAALASEWVTDECDWAYNLYRRDRANRVILPVLAETVNEDDIWLYMQQFKRIEQAGLQPWPAAEAARRVALALDPNAQIATTATTPPVATPPPTSLPDRADELDALMARANALVSQGKRRDAIAVLRQATTLAPHSVAAWNTLGYQLDYMAVSQQEASEALEAFERALLLEPNDAFAWAGRANALALHHPEQALAAAEQALKLDPGSAFGLNGKGAALNILGRHQEALDACERALSLDPTHAPAWNNKSTALNLLGRHQEALDASERALSLDPTHAAARVNKGYALNAWGRFREALDAYDRALALDPDDDVAWSNKGNALLNLGRSQEALNAYDRALSLGQNAIRWEGRASALRKLGREKEAEEAERKAQRLKGKQ